MRIKNKFSPGRALYAAAVFLMMCRRAEAITWLALKEEDVRGWSEGAAGGVVSDEGAACDRARELSVRPCSALLYVARAAAAAKSACKRAHSLRRWNCSTIDLAPDFTPELVTGTKEQSFVYALSSAALTYTMARACSSGSLFSCTCGKPPRERPNGNFKWGGCSDNLKWAGRFVRHFLEKSEEPPQSEIEDPIENHMQLMEGANKIGKRPRDNFTDKADYRREPSSFIKRDTNKKLRKEQREQKSKRRKVINKLTVEKRLKRLKPFLAVANLQNTKAGRKMMERSLSIQCKCHGVSGSCSVRTCWRSLEPLSMVAEKLWTAVTRSTRAAISKPRVWGPRRPSDLLYVSQSPSYCSADPSTGSLGTKNRWCNATSHSAEGSCRYLCCGRGYKTFTNESLERCNCKYIWCCKVECDVCKTITDTFYCN